MYDIQRISHSSPPPPPPSSSSVRPLRACRGTVEPAIVFPTSIALFLLHPSPRPCQQPTGITMASHIDTGTPTHATVPWHHLIAPSSSSSLPDFGIVSNPSSRHHREPPSTGLPELKILDRQTLPNHPVGVFDRQREEVRKEAG